MVSKPDKGDLVACYLLDSSLMEDETLLDYGIVIDVNPHLEDVLVNSPKSGTRWWPFQRWQILKKVKKSS